MISPVLQLQAPILPQYTIYLPWRQNPELIFLEVDEQVQVLKRKRLEVLLLHTDMVYRW